jgi:hypothetical protein
VIGVEDEQHVERALEDGIRLVLQLGHPEQHVQEVARVAQIVVGIVEGAADRVPERVRRNRRDFRNQADRLQPPRLGGKDVLRIGVERRQRAHRADEHAHRMGVVAEPLHQLGQVRMEHRVQRDLAAPRRELRCGGQLAEEDQVRGLGEIAVLRKLFDGIAAVLENALVAVDEGDAAPARRRIHVSGVVGHHSELVGIDLDLPEVYGPNRAVLNGNLVAFPRAVVGDG